MLALGALFAPLACAEDPSAIAKGAAPEATAQAQTAEPRFPAWEIRVVGNSVLPTPVVEAAVYPHLGPERTLKDVEAARDDLVQAYRSRGYGTVFVDIPEQNVEDGIVRLKVTEGRLDRVRVSGGRYFANGAIRERLTELQHDGVPNLARLQSELTEVNGETHDRTVVPVLRAGRTPGTVDVDLKVSDTLPLHGSAQVDNRYTADTTKTRLGLGLSYDNLFQENHSLALQYQTAPQASKEARVIAGTYLIHLQNSGNVLALYAVDSNSDVATVGTLAVLGKGRIYGMRYIVPFSNRAAEADSFTLGADYKDFHETILLTDQPGAQTPISYLNWSAGYSGSWRGAGSTSLSATANFGIRGFANRSRDFWFKRYSGKANKGVPDYFSLRLGFEREQPLFSGVRLLARLAGQYSPDPLINNEQLSIGGMDSVRGYLEAEELGDMGAASTLELRSPPLARAEFIVPADTYAFVFADAAIVGINAALPGQASRASLASYGAGFNFNLRQGMRGSLAWADALRNAQRTRKGDSRLVFEVKYGF